MLSLVSIEIRRILPRLANNMYLVGTETNDKVTYVTLSTRKMVLIGRYYQDKHFKDG